jgi:hypothetical protein
VGLARFWGLLQMPAYTHPDIDLPSDDCHVWRYMSFARFCDLLHTQALYFCRADNFPDRWEGVIPRALLEWVERHAAKPAWRQGATFAEHFRTVEISRQFFSCWHLTL